MLPRIYRRCLIVCSACLLATAASAQPQAPQSVPGAAPQAQAEVAPQRAVQAPPAAQESRPSLDTVTGRLAREMGRRFVVDPRVRNPDFGSIDLDEIDYPALKSLLRVHNTVVMEGEDVIYVVPEQTARLYAAPVVQSNDADLHPATWITRVITTTNDASPLLGVLRPMAPQSAVMAVYPPNKIVISDYYDSVKRITEVVRLLDQR